MRSYRVVEISDREVEQAIAEYIKDEYNDGANVVDTVPIHDVKLKLDLRRDPQTGAVSPVCNGATASVSLKPQRSSK